VRVQVRVRVRVRVRLRLRVRVRNRVRVRVRVRGSTSSGITPVTELGGTLCSRAARGEACALGKRFLPAAATSVGRLGEVRVRVRVRVGVRVGRIGVKVRVSGRSRG
jgi:hypothetical protein